MDFFITLDIAFWPLPGKSWNYLKKFWTQCRAQKELNWR